MSNLNNGGLTRVLNYIKTWVNGLLSGKSDTSHTHTKSQITDFPTIPTNTNQLTNGAGYLSGTVGITNGGTGATTRLDAVKNLTNENVGTSTQYFFTLTQNWGKVGYASVADAKSVLGVPTNTNQLTNGAGFITSSGSCNYANSAGSASTAAKLIGDDTRNNNYTPANYITSGQQATIRAEFKQRSTLGAPGDSTYGTSVTITPWRDNSGGRPVQLYFSDSYYTSAIRFATGDSSWSSWYQLNTEYYTKLNGYRIYVG